MAPPTNDKGDDAGPPRLLTISEAAALTGLTRRAMAKRVERGTVRTVKDQRGWRVVPRAELERLGLLGAGHPQGGDVVVWRELYDQTRQERDNAQLRARELELELVAIANAGPIRAARLRRHLRSKLSADASEQGKTV